MVNSGTEATMSAIRLARAATNRDKIVKFQGCYHGHADALLAARRLGAADPGTARFAGRASRYGQAHPDAHHSTTPMPVGEIFAGVGKDIAAVIVEPIAGNMGCIPPAPGFLEALREITADAGSVLIFDEVMTGFRVHRGGRPSRLRHRPRLDDPRQGNRRRPARRSVRGAKAEIMDWIRAPAGDVYQAGTLSGNPLAMRAGLALLGSLDAAFYDTLDKTTRQLTEAIAASAEQHGVPLVLNAVCGMFSLFFTDEPVRSFADVQRADAEKYGRFFHALLARGVYFAPSAFEAAFVSGAHDTTAVDATVAAIDEAFRTLGA